MISMLLRRLRAHATPAVVPAPPAPEPYVYGFDQTILDTTTVDIVLDDMGVVTEVWFRCHMLPFRVSAPKGHEVYRSTDDLPKLVAIHLTD